MGAVGSLAVDLDRPVGLVDRQRLVGLQLAEAEPQGEHRCAEDDGAHDQVKVGVVGRLGPTAVQTRHLDLRRN